jgi:hypothetical protein
MILLGIVVICVFLFIRECWHNIKNPQ